MTNAKFELLNHVVEHGQKIMCATITRNPKFKLSGTPNDNKGKGYEVTNNIFTVLNNSERDNHKYDIKLPCAYTKDELADFFNKLDFTYYCANMGEEELTGFIWYEDGSWSERITGSSKEQWMYCLRPHIPKELTGK
jgi:hypothetical protein